MSAEVKYKYKVLYCEKTSIPGSLPILETELTRYPTLGWRVAALSENPTYYTLILERLE